MRAALVSRQFIDMSRVRIEGLLAAFPKLVGSGKQHTYIETENVRYVYQPLEVRLQEDVQHQLSVCTQTAQSDLLWHNQTSSGTQALYLLLVTNKGSNILEDLETLRLLAKVVPEYVDSVDEEVRHNESSSACAVHTCDTWTT